MKVMYMSHRYHTNQNAIMKGWKEHGDEVCFLSQYAGRIEDYSCIRPIVVGYSSLFCLFYKFYVKALAKKKPNALDIRLKVGFPPLFKLARLMKEFSPDLVIMRERSVYTVCMTALCRLYRYKTILYTMDPVWEKPRKWDAAHRLVWKLVPEYRITPSLVRGTDYQGKEQDPKAFFAPYLMEPQLAPEKKRYFANGVIHILEVGKYEERKNHRLMLRTFAQLSGEYNIRLTIVGEVSNDFHRRYLKELEESVKSLRLEDKVTLLQNLDRPAMLREYEQADLFVLPSTGEPAAVTLLEAMAFSIPVIGGEDNGSACYVREGETGFIFKDNDGQDLKRKMEEILADRQRLREMGRQAYRHVEQNFQFDSYYRSVSRIMELENADNTHPNL